MKHPPCQALTTIKTSWDIRFLGRVRLRHCVICDTDFRTFQPSAGLEAGQEIVTDHAAICECGRVARHSKTIEILVLSNRVLQQAEMLLCDDCLELEREMFAEVSK